MGDCKGNLITCNSYTKPRKSKANLYMYTTVNYTLKGSTYFFAKLPHQFPSDNEFLL